MRFEGKTAAVGAQATRFAIVGFAFASLFHLSAFSRSLEIRHESSTAQSALTHERWSTSPTNGTNDLLRAFNVPDWRTSVEMHLSSGQCVLQPCNIHYGEPQPSIQQHIAAPYLAWGGSAERRVHTTSKGGQETGLAKMSSLQASPLPFFNCETGTSGRKWGFPSSNHFRHLASVSLKSGFNCGP